MDYEQTVTPEADEERMLSSALKAPATLRPVPASLEGRFARSFTPGRKAAIFAHSSRNRWRAAVAAAALCAVAALGAVVVSLLRDETAANAEGEDYAQASFHVTGGTGATGATGATYATESPSTLQPFNPSTSSTPSTSTQGDETMNTTQKRLAAPVAALAMAASAPQTATAAMDDWQGNAASPVVVIIVDVDMSLSDALTANSVSLAGAASLVKLGNGTVTVDDASGIGSFAGDIHVFKGGWSVGTAAGFGTSTGSTWVYPNGCVLVTDVTVAHTGETFHLAGTGKHDWYGWGAIRFPSSSQESAVMAAGSYGSRWILEDDATVLISGNGGNSGAFLPAIDLELNGHELTLWRGKYGDIRTGTQYRYGMFNSVTGGGGIVMENGTTFAQWGFNPPSYTAGNYLALQNAYLGIWETKSLHADWGLVAKPLPQSEWNTDPGSGTAAGHKPMFLLLSWKGADTMDHDFNRWRGPVTLEDNLQIAQENQNHIHPMTFTGKITGDGGLDVTSGKIWLYLDNPENDFQGGVTLRGPNDGLVLANNGALPADGGDLVATDSIITLAPSAAGAWSLPGLQFHGAGTVRNASSAISLSGAWSRVTKTGNGELKWDTTVGADTLDVREGTVTLGTTYSQYTFRGYSMWVSLDMATSDENGAAWSVERLHNTGTESLNQSLKNGTYVYNWFNNALSSNVQYNPIGNSSTGAIGYEGWLWCDGPDGTEWTFALSYGEANAFYLKINNTVVWNFNNAGYVNGANTPRMNVTMKHGWNRFIGMTKYGWTAANSRDSAWTLKGLGVDVNGRNSSSSADYDYFTDPGDGSKVVSYCGDNEADGRSWYGTFGTLAMRGGLLDLGGRDYTFNGFENAGTVVSNGNAAVTESWAIDCSQVGFDDWASSTFTDALTIGDNAEIVLKNPAFWPRTFEVEVATAGAAINRAPSVRVVNGFPGYRVKASCSGVENKTLKLISIPPATTIMVN